jgi:integrase
MALTDTKVKNTKSKAKPYKLTDGGGMYLLVRPNGSKYWQYRFRINNKQGTYQIGSYPDVSLKKARDEHKLAREHVAEGINPKAIKLERKAEEERNNHRFDHYYKAWLSNQNLAPSTLKDLKQRVKKNLTPFMDKKGVGEYTTLDLLKILQRVSERGARETAIKMAGVLRRVFNDILLLQLIETNPAAGLAELLPKPDPKKKKNFSHITNVHDLSNLLIAIDQVRPRQDYAVTMALRLMPLVFLRPKNIRYMKWEYVNFHTKQILFPAHEMKRNTDHVVPLSDQALKILKSIHELTGDDEYVFSTTRGNGKPMSENTTTKAIQTLIDPDTRNAYGKEFMTSHGFRHTASTFLNELGYDPDVIELQLAHINKDRIRATYNKAQWMEKRTQMMQEWADYLDQLKEVN